MKQFSPSVNLYGARRYPTIIMQALVMVFFFAVDSNTLLPGYITDSLNTFYSYYFPATSALVIGALNWDALSRQPMLLLAYLLALGISVEFTYRVLTWLGYPTKAWGVYVISFLVGFLAVPLWGVITFTSFALLVKLGS